jgi:hypothetical protein
MRNKRHIAEGSKPKDEPTVPANSSFYTSPLYHQRASTLLEPRGQYEAWLTGSLFMTKLKSLRSFPPA